MVPLYCGGSSLWVELDEWLVKVSWLGKLASVFWWVKLDLFSLECNIVHLYFNAQVMFLNCWGISLACLVLKLVGFWVELGFSVGMETSG